MDNFVIRCIVSIKVFPYYSIKAYSALLCTLLFTVFAYVISQQYCHGTYCMQRFQLCIVFPWLFHVLHFHALPILYPLYSILNRYCFHTISYCKSRRGFTGVEAHITPRPSIFSLLKNPRPEK